MKIMHKCIIGLSKTARMVCGFALHFCIVCEITNNALCHSAYAFLHTLSIQTICMDGQTDRNSV